MAVADSEQFTEWVCIDKKTGKIAPKYNVKFITDASSPNGGLWATYYDGSLMGYIEGTSDAVYLDDYESIVATRRKIKITKSGEAYVTLSGVQQLIPESPDLTVYATTTQVESVSISKRDKADNIAETDSNMYTPWKFESADTNVLSALVQNGTTLTYKKGSDGNNQWVYENCPYKIGDRYTLLFNGETQQQDEGTLLIEWPLYMDEDRAEYTTVIARRSNEVATKAGEPYVTTTFVTNSIAPYEAMKRKLDQIAALEPPSSTVRDLITWANAVQSILKGDLMGGDSSISPAAVLSSSNKYYWDKQTETCYRMTVENDYTIMRAVTNVPPTVEVVLALEKELNKETNK